MPPPLDEQTPYKIEQRIIRGDSTKDICESTSISQQQVDKMKRNVTYWGNVVAPHQTLGRPRLMDDLVESTLLDYVDEKPTAYLFEMVYVGIILLRTVISGLAFAPL